MNKKNKEQEEVSELLKKERGKLTKLNDQVLNDPYLSEHERNEYICLGYRIQRLLDKLLGEEE